MMEELKKTEIGFVPDSWKETQIGPIPVDWDSDILSNYSEKPQYGFTDSAADIGNAKFLRITDITEIGVDWSTVPFCNCPETVIDKYKLQNNDIVFARIGATTGKSYLIKNPPHAVFASYLIRIRTKEGLFPDFLYYYFNSELYWKQINSQKGNNLKGGVNGSILGNLTISIPPLPEQRKIAHVLNTVQKAIEQQDKLIRTTTELKKALMQKLFTEGTRGEPQRETEIGLVPESWEVVRIKKYILKTKNRDPRKEPEKDFVYVDVSSVSNEFFRIENTLKICGKEAPSRARKIIQDGDVIFATVRPTLKRIAKISQEYHNQICSTGYCVLKPDPDKLSQEYLYQYLQTEFFIERIEKLQRGASYPAVRDTDVKSIYIPLPILSEQKEIGKTLNILDLKNDVLINKKQTLTDLFKTLLHELMTGQRRVHELEFEKMEDF